MTGGFVDLSDDTTNS